MDKKVQAQKTIDSMREECESSREWKLRKLFLAANMDTLSQDRLVCLSKCFINSAMYGCSYPRQVMEEIKYRSHGLLENYQQASKSDRLTTAKQSYAASFVRASDSPSSGSLSFHQGAGSSVMSSCPPEKMSFVSESVSCYQPHAGAKCLDLQSLPHKKTAEKFCYKPSAVEIVEVGDYSGQEKAGDHMRGTELGASGVSPAQPILSLKKYTALWAKETNEMLKKLRLMACRAFKSEEKLALVKVLNSINRQLWIKVKHKWDPGLAKQMGARFVARIMFDDILAATGAGGTKVQARRDGFEIALQKVYMPYLRIRVTESGQKELEASREPFSNIVHQKRPFDESDTDSFPTNFAPSRAKLPRKTLPNQRWETSEGSKDLSQYPLTRTESNISTVTDKCNAGNKPLDCFIIVERKEGEQNTKRDANTLRQSADFSGMLLEYEFTVNAPACVSCVIRLEGQVVGEAEDVSKKTARLEASTKALEYLRPQCWLLKFKGTEETDTISKEELFVEIQQQTEVIGESNIGNKMLRKMGWRGGGVGKHGAGIVEPVSARAVLGRAGLGLPAFSSSGKVIDEMGFRLKVRDALKNYIQSGEEEDLKFAVEFSKDERKLIHLEANKLKLRAISRGRGESRYLTVGHKRSSQELLQHVSDFGGETKTYILLPPGSSHGELSERDDATPWEFSY